MRIDGPTTLSTPNPCGWANELGVMFVGDDEVSVGTGDDAIVAVAGQDVAVRNVASFRYDSTFGCEDASSGDQTTWLAARVP